MEKVIFLAWLHSYTVTTSLPDYSQKTATARLCCSEMVRMDVLLEPSPLVNPLGHSFGTLCDRCVFQILPITD